MNGREKGVSVRKSDEFRLGWRSPGGGTHLQIELMSERTTARLTEGPLAEPVIQDSVTIDEE
jgi:hypothetical protein